MLSLGIRIHQASLNKEENEINDIDLLRNILKTTLINNEISSEILSIIFSKERSRMGAFDSESSLKMAEQLAERYLKGGERL